MLGERDLAPVESRFFQRRQRLLFDHGQTQAAARKRAGQTQPGRATARDDEIKVHGGQGSGPAGCAG